MLKFLHFLRIREFLVFSRELLRIASEIRGVLITLFLLIVIGGCVFSRVEPMNFWNGQYLAFVTALTIGYGDLAPHTPAGRLTSIVLGLIGMVAVGLVVGAASVAVRRTFEIEREHSSRRKPRVPPESGPGRI